MNKLILYISNSKFVRIVLFLVVFYFIINLLFSNLVTNNQDAKLTANIEYLKTLNENNIDIFFFSNSFLFTAFDPLYLKYKTGLNSIHLGSSARRIPFELYTIKNVLKIRKPKIVVIDISSFTMRIPESNNEKVLSFNSNVISIFKPSIEKYNLISKYFPKKRNDLLIKSFSKTTNTLYQLSTINPFKKQSNSDNQGAIFGFTPILNTHFLKKKEYEDTFDSIYKIPISKHADIYKTIDSLSYVELKKTIKYFKRRPAIELVMINTIKLNSNTENQILIDSIKQEANTSNIHIIEFNSSKIKSKIDFSRYDFSDKYHPSKEGSLKLTDYFIDFLMSNNLINKESNDSNRTVVFKDDTKRKIKLKNFQVLLNKLFSKKLYLVLKNPSFNIDSCVVGINVFAKKGHEKYLQRKDVSNDNITFPLIKSSHYNNDLLISLNFSSKLREEDIDYFEFFVWDKKNKIATNKIKIDFPK